MRNLFLALHLLASIFAVGPLVHAATTASRGVRSGDGAAVATAARTARVYGYASLLVVLLGFGVMGMKESGKKPGFGDTWVWLSLVLYIIALVLVLGLLVPELRRAAAQLGSGAGGTAPAGRVAAVGGSIALLFAGIIFLMVYRPGS